MVYVESVLPRGRLFTESVIELNTKLELVARSTGATWVDVFSLFLDEQGASMRDEYANDELHLTGPGYVVWRNALAPHVYDGVRHREER